MQSGPPGYAEKLVVVLLGVAAFLVFIGPRPLMPDNIAWLALGDPAEHFLGWQFFRHAPWTFPLGLNPPSGLEISNAIVYSDSIPLLALLFKPLSPVLPPVFQFLGLWLLICFVLQAWFGWKLGGLATARPLLRLLLAALFVTAPPMLFRAPHHLALSGHFLILAAIYLVLRPDRRHQAAFWALILVVAGLVNAYLLLMAAACWSADVVQTLISRREPWPRVVVHVVATLAAVGLAIWQAGYFSEGEPTSGGFGYFRHNLLAPVDSSGWSYILPDIPGGPGDYEGFNYLGLGALILAVAAIALLIAGRTGVGRRIGRFPVFLAILVALAAYAVSNNIGIGPLELSLPLPPVLVKATSVFRASGRIFWPVYYALLFVIGYVVVRGLGPRIAASLLVAALAVQVADTSAGWRSARASLAAAPSPTWETTLVDPFWEEAAARYDAVRRIVPINAPPEWRDVSYYAATHRMGTDIVYLARIGHTRLAKAQRRAVAAARTGRYREDSLYIVAPQYLPLVAATLDRDADLLARIDGYTVVAPGWSACPDCPAAGAAVSIDDLAPVSPRGATLAFNADAATAQHLLWGWWPREAWGVWSSGSKAAVVLRVPRDVNSLTIVANAFSPAGQPRQRIGISLNGVKAADVRLRGEDQSIVVPITEEIRETLADDGTLLIRFRLPDATSPMALGLSVDHRDLALGLKSITVN